jgi:hypothetical protein
VPHRGVNPTPESVSVEIPPGKRARSIGIIAQDADQPMRHYPVVKPYSELTGCIVEVVEVVIMAE